MSTSRLESMCFSSNPRGVRPSDSRTRLSRALAARQCEPVSKPVLTRQAASRFRVPILVQRPAVAAETRRPAPLVIAPRASSACRERIPDRAAPGEEWLGRRRRITAPPTRRVRSPTAERTSHAAEDSVFAESGNGDRDTAGAILMPEYVPHRQFKADHAGIVPSTTAIAEVFRA